MRYSNGLSLVVLLLGLVVFPLVSAAADPAKGSPCDKIKEADKRNYCLATTPKNKEGGKFGYQTKDHSTYYCSLIQSRDYQNLCNAVVQKTKHMCDLIVKKELEAECLKHFK